MTIMDARVTLRDGREMVVRPAAPRDAGAVADEHPLPRTGQAPEHLYKRYYLLKSLMYTRAPVSGIVTGWVDDQLAGFVFFCEDMPTFRRFVRKPSTAVWLVGLALRGWFGWHPGFWLEALGWCRQHLRRVRADTPECEDPDGAAGEILPWVGTVHTVSAFRRLGVASHLLTVAEERLSQSDDGRVALWAAADNEPALNLYDKRGYVRKERRARIGEECWLMVKELRTDLSGQPPST